jgi:predicted HicB family RNase H-like nuclease
MAAKRRTVADDLRALAGGGIDALRAAEELLGRADDQLQIRVSQRRKTTWQAAAKAAGKSLSAWVIERVERR